MQRKVKLPGVTDFHERLLKVGNMPPALMHEGLMQSYEA
jgi:hypothetical protein